MALESSPLRSLIVGIWGNYVRGSWGVNETVWLR